MDAPAETALPPGSAARQQAAEPSRRLLRILFVVNSLEHGGAERQTINLFNRLSDRGHECHVAFIKNRRDQLERLRLATGGTVRSLDARRFLDRRAVDELARTVSGTRPCLVLAANDYALMYAALALRRPGLRVPLVVTFHATRLIGVKEQLKLLACLPLFWRADCSVFVCAAQRRRWLRRGVCSRRNVVIYNGVDTDEFSAEGQSAERGRVRAALGLTETDYVIGVAAGLRPEKNHVQLVDAVARLRERGVPAHALLIGDGEMRGAIEARARDRGMSGHVTITGFQSDVRPWVQACDTVALCSVTEAFSLAAIEAMALRKPVVHSRVGGAAEMIIPGWNGYLYPAGDVEALVRTLALLADRSLSRRMGRNARTTVERWFSERSMAERYERLLLELT